MPHYKKINPEIQPAYGKAEKEAATEHVPVGWPCSRVNTLN